MTNKLIVLAFLIISSAIANAGFCETRLSFPSATHGLISYLNILVEQKILSDKDLVDMVQKSTGDKLVNPISEERTKRQSPALVHREELERQIRLPVDKAAVLAWAEKLLKERSQNALDRGTISWVTKNASFKHLFRPIPLFRPLPGGSTEAFEMMTIPVTQEFWVNIMGHNPSLHKYGDHSREINVNGKTITMQPNNPVENITWWSALEFANRVSLRAGLDPAYNLERFKFVKGTRAEDGTLQKANKGAILSSEFFDSAVAEEGYRLPTNVEYEYILNAARSIGGQSFEKVDGHQYAWGASNTRFTQPVAQLLALRVFNENFWDIFGNVAEFTSTLHGSDTQSCLHRGGSFVRSFTGMKDVGTLPTNDSAAGIGLRLVRTLK